MKTLKLIDGKSMLIGCLLACTIFFATGAADDSDTAKQLRLLGFTEEEIKEELEKDREKAEAKPKKERPVIIDANKWDSQQKWEISFHDMYPPLPEERIDLIRKAKIDIFQGTQRNQVDRVANAKAMLAKLTAAERDWTGWEPFSATEKFVLYRRRIQ